jgi:hypothetical protein
MGGDFASCRSLGEGDGFEFEVDVACRWFTYLYRVERPNRSEFSDALLEKFNLWTAFPAPLTLQNGRTTGEVVYFARDKT